MNNSPLDRLCALYGVANEYHDITGKLHHVPDETRKLLLRAMGLELESDEDVVRMLIAAEEERWCRPLEPVAIGRAGDANLALVVALPEAEMHRPVHWHLTEES